MRATAPLLSLPNYPGSGVGEEAPRKPSCLISCSQRGPSGGRGAVIGRHGAMNPAGQGLFSGRDASYLAPPPPAVG
jgi:hypothetical protein